MVYHYLECGLDNVYLLDGFSTHQTPYGEGISIEDARGLYRRLGRIVAESAGAMTGAELRFLRKEMDFGQNQLAREIGATEQTLRLWEKHRDKPVPGTADRLVRALYREHVDGKVAVRKLLDKLAGAGEQERGPWTFSRVGRVWRLKATVEGLAA